MASLKFNAAQVKELTRLGLCSTQIDELKFALAEVKRALAQPPAQNDVRDILASIMDLSSKLSKRISILSDERSAAATKASVLIEEYYLQSHPMEDGFTPALVILPLLDEFAKASKSAIASMPSKPSRHRKASPRPIARIHHALLTGWQKTYGPQAADTSARTIEELTEEAKATGPGKPYPPELAPSATDNSRFRKIVSLCYEAAGAEADVDPLRAIRAYQKIKQGQRQIALENVPVLRMASVNSAKPRAKKRNVGK